MVSTGSTTGGGRPTAGGKRSTAGGVRTTAGGSPQPERAVRALTHERDGTSYTVRENLVDIVERELLGPSFGPEEVLPFSPRSHYLVGHLAPVKIERDADRRGRDGRREGPDPEAFDDDVIEERGDLFDTEQDGAASVDGVEVPPAEDDYVDERDDVAEDRGPRRGLMIPSSMGLRFQVPDDLEAVTVTASWGTYATVATGEVTAGGRQIRHFRRTPVEVSTVLRLGDLTPGVTESIPLHESVCIRVDRYDDPAHGRRLVELALCNDKVTQRTIPLGEWLFQTKLHVAASEGSTDPTSADAVAVFLPVRDAVTDDWPEEDEELSRLQLQYRDRLEFAVGRTCSVDWAVASGERRATAVWTTWLPTAETPQTATRELDGVLLGMDRLAAATPAELRAGLTPIVDGYAAWLAGQQAQAAELPPHLRETADRVIEEAEVILGRLRGGLDHLVTDLEAQRCFAFMNAVMRDQRIATQVAALRSGNPRLDIAGARAAVLGGDPEAAERAARWRVFQLAFILMQLPALTDPTHERRSREHGSVELLFFPTGGGKTEAYLGLAAYTLAIRRRHGLVQSADGPLNGSDGVAVLMRYTLRLLTAQQFQRATAMVCAAELIRADKPEVWGTQPFRIGLWVGTDVSPKRFDEAEAQLLRAKEFGAHRLTVLQVQRCPWCGTPITSEHVTAHKLPRRVLVHCGDELARCPFAKGGSVAEGLPMLTVDEEIYRLTPAFVIATVDKFARLAREGAAAALFGYVARRCGRHGYAHPDYETCAISTAHKAEPGFPTATVRPVSRLRPPDLVIQDELHLITGALGTSVGLFEAAVETLATWETADGRSVKPMIVASTATVRNARDQARALYGREVEIFPPQVLDVADSFFAHEVPPTPTTPARRYLGVSAQGVRLTNAEIRLAEVLLSAGQLLLDQSGAAADPYATLVGYFSATRELAGMSRYLADDVQNRVKRPRQGSGFPLRVGMGAAGSLHVGELTSRIASAQIGATLDRLSLPFDPDRDTTAAVRRRIAAQEAGESSAPRGRTPYDALLATSMLQVGVDVPRLGLMVVVGQPKNTAEYIQASSRVGREAGKPGLVVALGNWARPRDLAHFEQFRHYHETFYAQVEPLSVTPYSTTSLDRGLDGLLVSAARVSQAHLADGVSPELAADRVVAQRAALDRLAARLERRMSLAARDEEVDARVHARLVNRLDRWCERVGYARDRRQGLAYERTGTQNRYLPLLSSPENRDRGLDAETAFTVANSMREVQPEIIVRVSPLPERLFLAPVPGAPRWELPAEEEER